MNVIQAHIILDLDFLCSTSEIRKSYKFKSLLSHPDKGGTKEEFTNINLAYKLLIDFYETYEKIFQKIILTNNNE